jgi:hypothetical protein
MRCYVTRQTNCTGWIMKNEIANKARKKGSAHDSVIDKQLDRLRNDFETTLCFAYITTRSLSLFSYSFSSLLRFLAYHRDLLLEQIDRSRIIHHWSLLMIIGNRTKHRFSPGSACLAWRLKKIWVNSIRNAVSEREDWPSHVISVG